MSDLASMESFRLVVREGSFSAAARALGVPKSTVSRQVASLEARLGVRLLVRTSRRTELTEVGQAYYADLEEALGALDRAERNARERSGEARGSLRLSAPMSFGQRYVGGLVASYLDAHPNVSVEVVLSDALTDLIADRFDVALRIRSGGLDDSSLVARRIGSTELIVCASPAYLEAHGVPGSAADLTAHACLLYALAPDSGRWRIGGEVVTVRGRLTANNGDLLRAAAVDGAGIVALPRFIVEDDVHAGRLVPILEPAAPMAGGIYLVWPSGRFLERKTRLFIDHVIAQCGPFANAATP